MGEVAPPVTRALYVWRRGANLCPEIPQMMTPIEHTKSRSNETVRDMAAVIRANGLTVLAIGTTLVAMLVAGGILCMVLVCP
jgi:hypothetical protein